MTTPENHDDYQDPRRVLSARITKALSIAPDGMYDGGHHKMWVIDQMVRALTGCPPVNAYELGTSDQYVQFLNENPGWDEGIAP
jgi:hypothetical protein